MKVEDGTLAISNIQKTNEGYYLCEAVNGIGSGLSAVILISVQGNFITCVIITYCSLHSKLNFTVLYVQLPRVREEVLRETYETLKYVWSQIGSDDLSVVKLVALMS